MTLFAVIFRVNASEPEWDSITLTDEVGNLYGDSTRLFLDIRRVQLQSAGHKKKLTLLVAGKFPNPDSMLGTGLRFNIDFLRTGQEDPSSPRTQIQYQLRISLDSNYWQYGLYEDTGSTDPIDADLTLQTTSRSVAIIFDSDYLKDINQISTSSTTSDFPKWTPVTGNPPVILLRDGGMPQNVSILSN